MLIWPDSCGAHCCARAAGNAAPTTLLQMSGYACGNVSTVFPSAHSPVVQGAMPGMHALEQLAPDLATSANAMSASGLLTAPGAYQEHDSEQPSGGQAEVTSHAFLLLIIEQQATCAWSAYT